MGSFPFFAIAIALAIALDYDDDAAAAAAAVAWIAVATVAVFIAICPYNDDGTLGWFFVNSICFVNIIFYLRAKRNEKKFKIHISNYIRK